MRRLLQNRLVLQLLLTLVAGLCVACLSVVLIRQAIGSAERVVVGEARRTLNSALQELKQQCQYRLSSDSSWSGLPAKARDISLRGITQTVLRSFPGVEGGFYLENDFEGYAFPTHDIGTSKIDVPNAERGLIVSTNNQSIARQSFAERLIYGRSDLLVIAALPLGESQPGGVVWTMKRLVGRGERGAGQRDLLLAVLVIAALVSIVFTLATGLSLARGIAQIQSGLLRLETEFEYPLPERADELGNISRAINRMATAHRQLESQVRREDRLRALGQLAASLAHEIRNPLNSIRLTIQLLERKAEVQSIRRDDLRTVRAEVDRLNALLNDLLDLQRSRQPPQPRTQAVLPVLNHCREVISQHAEMQGTSVHAADLDGEIEAYFDSQQLKQAVVNLLLNALEATESGGRILVRTYMQNGAARIEVQDDGPGLDAEQRDHIFEPFYTTKPKGTGLGLAVSRELMRSQGGDLRFVTTDSGACFIVDLPKAEEKHFADVDTSHS